LPYEAWEPVFKDARARGLEVFASCWDEAAVEWCESQDVGWYKVGSADITNYRLLNTIAATGKGVLMSTGAATGEEIREAVDRLRGEGAAQVIPMACTLSYPCEMNDARLGRISWLVNWLANDLWRDVPVVEGVGYSDHTPGISTAGLAVAAGASYLEKHFTVTPGAGGDHDFALDKDRMVGYVWAAEEAFRMVNSDPTRPIGDPLPAEWDARRRARRSLHAVEIIRMGEPLIVGENCLFLRPAEDGIPASAWAQDYMGDAVKDYDAGEQI